MLKGSQQLGVKCSQRKSSLVSAGGPGGPTDHLISTATLSKILLMRSGGREASARRSSMIARPGSERLPWPSKRQLLHLYYNAHWAPMVKLGPCRANNCPSLFSLARRNVPAAGAEVDSCLSPVPPNRHSRSGSPLGAVREEVQLRAEAVRRPVRQLLPANRS